MRPASYIIFGCLCLCLFKGQKLLAQHARIELFPEEIVMGQHGRLIIEIEAPSEGTVILPGINDIETVDIEMIRYGAPDTLHKDGQLVSLRQNHVITAWKEGYFPLTPLVFKHIAKGDTTIFESRAALLKVQGVDVDMAEQYKDIRPIMRIPIGLRELIPWLLLIPGLALLLFFLFRWLRNRKPAEAEESIWEKPDVPAHIAAISSLETLRRKQLWQAGKTKQYHSELTTILRLYMHKRFDINALEMTTSEIMQLLDRKLDKQSHGVKAREILEMADLVKFAKHQPGPEKHEWALETALDFVRNTIPAYHADKQAGHASFAEPLKKNTDAG